MRQKRYHSDLNLYQYYIDFVVVYVVAFAYDTVVVVVGIGIVVVDSLFAVMYKIDLIENFVVVQNTVVVTVVVVDSVVSLPSSPTLVVERRFLPHFAPDPDLGPDPGPDLESVCINRLVD